jgi:two-component system KDP operon response regulator KdpE
MTMSDTKPLILCIDDDPDVLAFLRIVLEDAGYAYVGAESGEAGLRAYRETGADAVIVDLMMEEVDSGAAFVRDLLALGNRSPVFMLSSVGDSLNLLTDSSELGLAGVFQKPLARAQLLSVLEAALAGARRPA